MPRRVYTEAFIAPADHPSGMFWWGWMVYNGPGQRREHTGIMLESQMYFEHYLELEGMLVV